MKGYTWDEIYKRAEGAACGSPELKAKDYARWNMRRVIEEDTGIDIEECEIPEEEIERYLEESGDKYLFDEYGNFLTEPQKIRFSID